MKNKIELKNNVYEKNFGGYGKGLIDIFGMLNV
jgi:hypothetical protein